MGPLALNAAELAMGAAFIGSLVESVEAFTVVLAVASTRGARTALAGATAGLAALAALIFALGPALERFPLTAVQLGVGVLLLLFGTRWLRKAILRSAGRVPMRDESAIFAAETARLDRRGWRAAGAIDWLGLSTAFQAVLLEGLEVAFIVVAVGVGHGAVGPASVGAVAACVLVAALGLLLRYPLSRIPENALKFAVG